MAGIQKIKLAQDVAGFMDPEVNRSKSFANFRDALKVLADGT